MKRMNVSVCLFLGVLYLLFACGLMMPEERFSESENRYLAGKPKFHPDKLLDGSFGTEYEDYLSDQFPARDQFVAAKTNMERLLFTTDVNEVYFGKEGYYIEKYDSEDLNTEQLSKNLSYLADAVDLMAERVGEERVKIMMIPSASEVLTDKLPAFASPANQSGIVEKLKEMLKTPSMLLPVEQELLEHRAEDIYYKTDHHWTSLGAYYAYCLYGGAAGFTPWTEESFSKDIVSEDFLGTIESKVRVGMQADKITLYMPGKSQEYKVYYDGLPTAHDTLYNLKALEGKDKYAIFLDGNHGWTRIVNETVKQDVTAAAKHQGRKLLIVKDSYAHSFAPFAANHFGEVHMVDLRYFNMNLSAFMDTEGITDVLILYQIPGFAKDANIFKMVR